MVVGAFGHLKERFHCLLTRLDLGEWNIPQVVVAYCVLHNICKNKGETFLPGSGSEDEQLARAFEHLHTAAIW